MHASLKQFIWAVALLTLAGCATVDFDHPKSVTTAFHDTDDTYLGQSLVDDVALQQPGYSGFLPLNDGIDALAVRLLMAEEAERSLDAQYYLLKNDVAGRAFIYALLRAADRGVRVRLLLDDVFTDGYDAGMAGLDSHPNFEIRIFNPFANRSARLWNGITDFGRVNRRMHNKSFTADNQITLIGGRNIADEYFGAREDAKFGDLDVLGIGPVVNDVSEMFDSYWNHERAAPIGAFAMMPDDPAAELARIRVELEKAREKIVNTRYAEAVRAQAFEYVETDNDVFTWAPYVLAVDSPDKAFKSRAAEAESITTALIESLESAEKEMIIVSPYFVPRTDGMKALTAIRERGIEVIIITNSLAANNQFAVHGGYAPSRRPLLEAGVKIYEVRPDAEVSGSEIVAASGAKATLHTKAFVVDRRELFIGSFNFDPRSANINTELGVIIKSPELATVFAEVVDARKDTQAYEVYLTEDDQLRWRSIENGQEAIYKNEPKTTWWQRFVAGFMRVLPIRGQL